MKQTLISVIPVVAISDISQAWEKSYFESAVATQYIQQYSEGKLMTEGQ